MSKDLKQIRREAESRGWEVAVTNGNHLRWKFNGRVMFTALTPSDHRALKNIKSMMRRIEQGLPVR